MGTSSTMSFFFGLGCLLAGTGVAAGAFGSHALAQSLPEEQLSTFRIAVRYQLVHGLALLAVALAAVHWPGTMLHVAGWCIFAGIVLFSGSIYVLTLSETKWVGFVTPIGGTMLMIGWLMLACHVFYAQ